MNTEQSYKNVAPGASAPKSTPSPVTTIPDNYLSANLPRAILHAQSITRWYMAFLGKLLMEGGTLLPEEVHAYHAEFEALSELLFDHALVLAEKAERANP